MVIKNLVQQQGSGQEWVESDFSTGEFTFITGSEPLSGDVLTVLYTATAFVPPVDKYVAVSVTDTAGPGYLDDKINIHSSDSSVTVTKTITGTPNEVLDYDLVVAPGGNDVFSGVTAQDITIGADVFKATGVELKCLAENPSGITGTTYIHAQTIYYGTIFTIPFHCDFDRLVMACEIPRMGTWTIELRNVVMGAIGNTVIATTNVLVGLNGGGAPYYLELNSLGLTPTQGDQYALVSKWVGTSPGSAFGFMLGISGDLNSGFSSTDGVTWFSVATAMVVCPVLTLIPNEIYVTDPAIFRSNYQGVAQSTIPLGGTVVATKTSQDLGYNTTVLNPNFDIIPRNSIVNFEVIGQDPSEGPIIAETYKYYPSAFEAFFVGGSYVYYNFTDMPYISLASLPFETRGFNSSTGHANSRFIGTIPLPMGTRVSLQGSGGTVLWATS